MRVKASDLCPDCRSIIWEGTGITMEQALDMGQQPGGPFDCMTDVQYNAAVYVELLKHHCRWCLRTMAALYPGCCE